MIDAKIVFQLIYDQFPQYLHLPISEVKKQGHDNKTYRLGKNLLIRLPTAETYALKVRIEQDILKYLSENLKFHIPIPVHLGIPTSYYPYHFSIYKFLLGRSINLLQQIEKNQLAKSELFAASLGGFLRNLQSIDSKSGPLPGQHNWWRGDSLDIYTKETYRYLTAINKYIDYNKALQLWTDAISMKWNNKPLWIHGDLAPGNILVKDNILNGIIDFGGSAVGDPACDLTIAWTFFFGKARSTFLKKVNLDSRTILRAKAWTLWKASCTLFYMKNKRTQKAQRQINIIQDILQSDNMI